MLIDTTNWGLVACDGKTVGGHHLVTTINNVRPDGNVDIVGLPLGFEYFQTNPNVRGGSFPLLEMSETATILFHHTACLKN